MGNAFKDFTLAGAIGKEIGVFKDKKKTKKDPETEKKYTESLEKISDLQKRNASLLNTEKEEERATLLG